jgi:hypothetical protein
MLENDTHEVNDITLPKIIALYIAQVMCLLSLKNAGALRTVKHRYTPYKRNSISAEIKHISYLFLNINHFRFYF